MRADGWSVWVTLANLHSVIHCVYKRRLKFYGDELWAVELYSAELSSRALQKSIGVQVTKCERCESHCVTWNILMETFKSKDDGSWLKKLLIDTILDHLQLLNSFQQLQEEKKSIS